MHVHDGAKRGDRVVERGRVDVLGREPVVEHERDCAGSAGQMSAQRAVEPRTADDVAAAVQVQHRARAFGRTDGEPLGRPPTHQHVLDVRSRGRAQYWRAGPADAPLQRHRQARIEPEPVVHPAHRADDVPGRVHQAETLSFAAAGRVTARGIMRLASVANTRW